MTWKRLKFSEVIESIMKRLSKEEWDNLLSKLRKKNGKTNKNNKRDSSKTRRGL